MASIKSPGVYGLERPLLRGEDGEDAVPDIGHKTIEATKNNCVNRYVVGPSTLFCLLGAGVGASLSSCLPLCLGASSAATTFSVVPAAGFAGVFGVIGYAIPLVGEDIDKCRKKEGFSAQPPKSSLSLSSSSLYIRPCPQMRMDGIPPPPPMNIQPPEDFQSYGV